MEERRLKEREREMKKSVECYYRRERDMAGNRWQIRSG
jgi:hypothetical protein